MELRRYAKVLRRRWLIAVIPALLVLVLGVATYDAPPPVYNVGVRFIVSQAPGEEALTTDEQRYYNWLTSEYIVNGLTDWVTSGLFAEAVSEALAADGHAIPPGAVQATADNTRSMLTLSLSGGDPAALELMMGAAVAVLTEQNAAALPQLGGETAVLTQLDQPVVTPIPAGIRGQLDLPLRIVLAVGVGIGLALLAEYVDPTIRDREAVQQMDLPLLGEIPKK